jgi:hypothetical protein
VTVFSLVLSLFTVLSSVLPQMLTVLKGGASGSAETATA